LHRHPDVTSSLRTVSVRDHALQFVVEFPRQVGFSLALGAVAKGKRKVFARLHDVIKRLNEIDLGYIGFDDMNAQVGSAGDDVPVQPIVNHNADDDHNHALDQRSCKILFWIHHNSSSIVIVYINDGPNVRNHKRNHP
jgi:hypothetical protein